MPRIWERIRRRIQVEKNLSFEYEVSPHRAFLEKEPPSPLVITDDPDPNKFGNFIPFKQVRLEGQVNPLRPPIHVETVLIGRALGQSTGYRFGVGFRIRDDGYVEAEFSDAVRKYNSLDEFELDITARVRAAKSN